MTTPHSIFVVDLQYVVPLADVDAHIPGHLDFLNESYDAGLFLMSGPKVPRTGGMIIARAESKEALKAHLAKDLFNSKKIANYQITEFQAKMHIDGIFD